MIVDTNRTLPLTLNVFRDKLTETIILCSENKFKRHRTSYGIFIPVKELDNGRLCPHSILDKLGKSNRRYTVHEVPNWQKTFEILKNIK